MSGYVFCVWSECVTWLRGVEWVGGSDSALSRPG